MLVCAVQQWELIIIIYEYPLCLEPPSAFLSHLPRSSHSTRLGSRATQHFPPAICFTRDSAHSSWSKSEREKQIPYINTYIWNLERWYWWNCLQGSNRDRHREQTMDMVVGRFKREGTYVYLWLIQVAVWQKSTQYCKAIILQLNINNFFKMCVFNQIPNKSI